MKLNEEDNSSAILADAQILADRFTLAIAESIQKKYGWTLLNRADAEEARGVFAAVAIRCGCEIDQVTGILGCSMASAVRYQQTSEQSLRQRELIRALEVERGHSKRGKSAVAMDEVDADLWVSIVDALGRPLAANEDELIRERFENDIAGREIPSGQAVSCVFASIVSADGSGLLELTARPLAVDSYDAGSSEEDTDWDVVVTAGLFPIRHKEVRHV